MLRNKFSVIVIAFNEEKNISACIRSIYDAGGDEIQIILSDGGSSDDTVNIALEKNIEILNSPPGRGVQFNSGAKYADGNILLFLHADTLLPKNAFEILDKIFQSCKVDIGTFALSFDKKNILLTFYTKFTGIDSIFTKFGDQCIVIRKDFFHRLNGFKEWPLYEDVDLLRRARKLTKIFSFPASVITSARRFEEKGIIKQQVINGWHILLFLLGKSPAELAEIYNSTRTKNIIENKIGLPIKINCELLQIKSEKNV